MLGCIGALAEGCRLVKLLRNILLVGALVLLWAGTFWLVAAATAEHVVASVARKPDEGQMANQQECKISRQRTC